MKRIFFTVLFFAFLSSLRAIGADYYVAPDGNDANAGTISSPFRSLQKAILLAAAGDYIYLRGGVYYESTGITVARGNDGTAVAPKHIYAYAGETPVLNFSAQAELSNNRGLTLNGHHWHVKGIIVEGAGDNGIFIGGNNNTVEKCVTRRNRDTGLQLGRYSSSATTAEWPSNNLIVDCESYDNKDASNENADGFACKLTTGPGNIFRRCIAHHNIDDGWDLYTKTDTGPIGAVTLEDCIAHSNGTLTTGGTSGNGDKNGFKLGGEGIPVNHIVRRCIAFNNGKHGFTYNSNPGSIEMSNCTGYKNAQRNFSFDAGTHVYKNNLSYLPASNDKVIGDATAPNAFSNDAKWGFSVTASSFQSLTPGPDANPTANGFLHLAQGSPLIDAGVLTTGISYSGSAPDLGAVEFGGTTNPPVTTYTLSVSASPASSGTVTKNPDRSGYTADE
jgi:pectate disaccharide-lyase